MISPLRNGRSRPPRHLVWEKTPASVIRVVRSFNAKNNRSFAVQFQLNESRSRFHEKPEFLRTALGEGRSGWVLIENEPSGSLEALSDLLETMSTKSGDTVLEVISGDRYLQRPEDERGKSASDRTPSVVLFYNDRWNLRSLSRPWPCSIVRSFRLTNSVEDITDSFPLRSLSFRESRTVPARYKDLAVLRVLATPAVFATDWVILIATAGATGVWYGNDYCNLIEDLGYLPFPFSLGPDDVLEKIRSDCPVVSERDRREE